MFSLCLLTLEAQPRGQAPGSGRLTVSPVTTFGVSIRGVVTLELSEVGTGAQYRTVASSPGLAVPFGVYRMRLQAPGFETTAETISVLQAQVELRLGMTVAHGHSYEHPRIEGTVGPVSRLEKGLWVKLNPVYNGGLYQAPVSEGGAFSLVGIPAGMYVVCVFQGPRLLHAQPVEIIGKEKIRVVLPGGP
jgi:hypothetical protein